MLRHLTAIILGLLMSAPSDGDSMSLRSPGGNEGGAYPTEGVNQLIEALMVSLSHALLALHLIRVHTANNGSISTQRKHLAVSV